MDLLKRVSQIDYRRLIQGYVEAERLPKDILTERNVPDFGYNVLNTLGLLYNPVVDENNLARGRNKPIWPDEKPFAVCLTHDVDHVSQYSLKESSRKRSASLKQESSTNKKIMEIFGWGLDAVRKAKRDKKPDPLHCYERWLEVEEKYGARSTFFFWPGWKTVSKHHHTDCLYDLEDKIVFDRQICTVSEMIREIKGRGWEIGLHASWYSYNNVEEMKRQKAVLEETICQAIFSVRQHYLHYDIRFTPRVQAEAGFQYDSTLGFNDNIGFRFGTCYPWRLYDLKTGKELSLIEVPLIIQDGAMLRSDKGMRLDEKTAFEYVKQMTEAVERVGGVLTLLWHPNAILNPQWWEVYIRSIAYLKEKNAYFGSVQRISEYWKQNNNQYICEI